MKFKQITMISFLAVAAAMVGCEGGGGGGDPQPPEKVTGLFINEVYSSNPDWIELYNNTNQSIDIGGFVLQNNKGAAEEYVIPKGTTIGAKSFLAMDQTDRFRFDISANGDYVKLFDTEGRSIDEVVTPKVEGNASYGRQSDGGTPWKMFEYPTKGESNTTNLSNAVDGKIVINEAYSRGKGTANPDELDWVEIYNLSDEPLDIGGLMLSDQESMTNSQGEPAKVTVPQGTALDPGEFLVIEVDVDGGFGLSSGGDKVLLFDAAGEQIDATEFGSMRANESWSRFPADGTGEFRLQSITKGTTNSTGEIIPPVVVGDYTGISINEAYSRGQSSVDPGFDWVELYNASDQPVDIGGLMMTDTAGTLEHWVIPQGTTIASRGFFVIETEDAAGNGFGLSSNGDKVWLMDPAGEELDYIEFGPMEETESWSAFPDGSDSFRMQAITKNASNNLVAGGDYTGLVINEVDGNNKFVELYNNSSEPISLEGVSLTKDGKDIWWTGGAGTSIAAGGFYTIVQAGEENENNTAANEFVGTKGISAKKTVKFDLKNPAGSVVIDSFERTAEGLSLGDDCAPDYGVVGPYSFSRCPDGTGGFGLAAPSCNIANPAASAGAIETRPLE